MGRMGSRLLSRLIIILQFRTEFHHLPQTQLIRYRRQTAGSGSLCRVVFALGQAKFCVFASTIRINCTVILAHFPGELASFTVFCSVFKRRQEYVKLAPGFVAFERTCSYQFSWLETVKKNIHIGIFDFWLLAAEFPQSLPANGSQM